ncbi:YceI family protein [Dongshaea marina]|uniref:YceI family protein n=1 Tax=Dongshaea marina TaxID=2047966 RepID=UPI000D3E77AE|nr:YceI family protein [Dongshaea marina]
MKTSWIVSMMFCLFAVSGLARAEHYIIDSKGAHASVNLKIKHLGYSWIKGRFNTFSGTFDYDPKDVAASKVKVVIETASFDSNHAERDKHVRSKDFLDVKQYPQATFVSSRVTDLGGGKLSIEGKLTLHGQTHPMTIAAHLVGQGKDPWGGYRTGFEGSAELPLADYGIKVIGASKIAYLELHIEGIRQ